MPKILIAQDNEQDAKLIADACKVCNYTVLKTVDNYDDAVSMLYKEHPDLLITSIKLNSEKNGLDLSTTAQQKLGIATMFVASFVDEKVLLKAKNIDFYGYIIKPFKEDELIANIRLALYQVDKNRKVKKRYIDIDKYIFDLKEGILYDEDSEIKLSPKLKKLLCFLSQNYNQVKSYDEIIDYLYDGEEVTLETLRQLIKRIRKIVGKNTIETIKGVGYRLVYENR